MSKILFLVEGKKTEPKVIRSIENIFFKKHAVQPFKICCLPFKSNIYNLFKALQADQDLNVIEVVKEQNQDRSDIHEIDEAEIAEIYLLFDFDAHDRNHLEMQKIEMIKEMLTVFDNETENGKLYLSYPMVEALQDIDRKLTPNDMRTTYEQQCESLSQKQSLDYTMPNLLVPCWQNINYKSIVGNSNFQQINKYTQETWQEIISYHNMKMSVFYGEFNHALESSQREIFEQQMKIIDSSEHMFVLSAYPQFLIDYFGTEKLMESSNQD